ncbi:MAG: hypothetical protein HYV34_02005 [Candidatus Kerfeldbacteria bacterium]|nr:hypothetical protein [Candidatus Kerfeldbacteria bacterium]
MFARLFSELVAWNTFLALWVWASTYFFWLLLGLPQEIGAYVFGCTPVALAVSIYVKRRRLWYEMHLHFVAAASGAAMVGVASHFLAHLSDVALIAPVVGMGTHFLLGGLGVILLFVGGIWILYPFRGYPFSVAKFIMPLACSSSFCLTTGLFAWGMRLAGPLAAVLVIASSTALALEFRWWPRGAYWVRSHLQQWRSWIADWRRRHSPA